MKIFSDEHKLKVFDAIKDVNAWYEDNQSHITIVDVSTACCGGDFGMSGAVIAVIYQEQAGQEFTEDVSLRKTTRS